MTDTHTKPNTTETSETSEAAEARETHEARETSEARDTRKAPGARGVPPVPEARETSTRASEARETRETPMTSEARGTTDRRDMRKAPEAAEMSGSRETPERPAAPPASAPATAPASAPAAAPASADRRTPSAQPGGAGDALEQRMQKAVVSFVDEPKSAVGEAEKVLATALEQAERAVAGARAAVAQGGSDTEALRLALRRYRALTSHLLALPTP
ncbi:hypothetical protein ACWERV_13775 [Streptomyces sp. NPDC004031]